MIGIGVIIIFILIVYYGFKFLIFLIELIPKYGLQFLILKCPNCKKLGGLKKSWKYSTEKEIESGNNDEIIDAELVFGVEKILSCKRCNHKIII